MVGNETELIAHRQAANEMTPYERLLGDALNGDSSLFTRAEAVEAAWRVVQPILKDPPPVAQYAPETWGPAAADSLLAPGECWYDPVQTVT
jgi:glucose-6-phosphate 1-dehydrogenase